MILPIYLYGQPVLRRSTDEIDSSYPDLKQLISDMYETLTVAEGCGLAAPQIGRSIRVFVVDGSELGEDYPECVSFKQAFINPQIIEFSEDKSAYSEGCLSLPGISETVIRPKTIKIKYFDEDFNEHIDEFTDFKARIVLHEYDHLEGNVFTDKISPIRRQFVKSKLSNIAKGKTSARYKTKRNA
ncbi:MAG: peptide deformylase [Paludibacteraceae bacterium]|nr:peptide deformylase [Paludibacteraceae bacterium]